MQKGDIMPDENTSMGADLFEKQKAAREGTNGFLTHEAEAVAKPVKKTAKKTAK